MGTYLLSPPGGRAAFLVVGTYPEPSLLRIVPGGPPYENLFASADAGLGTPGYVGAVAADPGKDGRLVLATTHGSFFDSRDDGRTWAPLGVPPEPERLLGGLVIAPQGRLIAVAGNEVLLSDDDARTWRLPRDWPVLPTVAPTVLLSDPLASALYAEGPQGLLRSTDRGATWQDFDDGLPAEEERTLYVSGVDVQATVASDTDLRTYRLDRPSATWQLVATVPVEEVQAAPVVCPVNAPLVVAGNSRRYCSTDGGQTWSAARATDAFETQVSASGRQFRLVFPNNLVDPIGIDTRAPGAETWQRELPQVSIEHLALHPTDGDRAFVIGRTGGRRWSFHRDGSGWHLGSRLDACSSEPGEPLERALYNPAEPDWLYLVADRCIQFSRNAGASWQMLDEDTEFAAVPRPMVADRHDPRWLYFNDRRILLTTAEPLRLGDDGRFEVTLAWKDFRGRTGNGTPVPITGDTGYFWFFDPANVELVVKVLDGGPINQHYWVFYGALSNVEYDMTVRDTRYGFSADYANPPRTLASRGDTEALPRRPEESVAAVSSAAPAGVPRVRTAQAVEAEPLTVQDGRFAVRVEWEDFKGNAGVGMPQELTGDTGYFWFFNPANVELVVKVLDGRPVNGRWWVFYGALSNVAYRVTVTDTVSGETAVYDNPSGTFASFADTAAFPRP